MMKEKKGIVIALCALLTSACDTSQKKAAASMKCSLKEDSRVITYSGDEIDPLTMVHAEDANGVYSPDGSGDNVSDTLSVTCTPASIENAGSGTYHVTYTLSTTDEKGNKVYQDFNESFEIKDDEPPVIKLAGDEIEIGIGTQFDPTPMVESVMDPVDGNLEKVDSEPDKIQTDDEHGPVYETGWYTVSSDIDVNTEGEYPVTIHACDRNGNTADAVMNVKVSSEDTGISVDGTEFTAEPSETAVSDYAAAGDTGNEKLNEMCDSILSQITNSSMDDYTRCYAIYQWVENNIYYVGGSDHSDWIAGALTALGTRRGDCFAYCSSGMALLTRAGFTVQMAHIADTHYWVKIYFNDQWLNWDATTGWGTERFLWTDDQIRAYSYTNSARNYTVSYAGY